MTACVALALLAGLDLQAHRPREATEVRAAGYLRTRAETIDQPGADLRLRTDLAIHPAGLGVAVKARADVFDGVALGGAPQHAPGTLAASARGQGAPADPLRVTRMYGEAVTPVGWLAVGRMGSHWGLGVLDHAGDCDDCDGGDTRDRVAFTTRLLGQAWSLAYDLTARDEGVHTLTFGVLHRGTVSVGALVARRWQRRRDLEVHFADVWARWSADGVRVEAEVVGVDVSVGQASTVPGVELARPVTERQLGVALETDLGPEAWGLGVDGGFASADFAFNPEYHVDRLAFRGADGVADAAYVRPHGRVRLLRAGPSTLSADLAVVGSGARRIELDPALRYASTDGLAVALEYAWLHDDGSDAQRLRVRAMFRF